MSAYQFSDARSLKFDPAGEDSLRLWSVLASARARGDAPQETLVSLEERRKRDRISLSLAGRYLLADGAEFPCRTVDISPIGIAIRGLKAGLLGERVVAYIDELGRIEGVIVRRAPIWFVLDVRGPFNKLQRLAKKIDWQIKRRDEGTPDRRTHERVDFDQEETVLRTADGRCFLGKLIDVSISGAALYVDVAPPIGSMVTLDLQPAIVRRHFPGGIGLSFGDAD